MPRMTNDEVQQFLDERENLVRIGTVSPDGQPSVLPAWFLYRDDRIFVTLRARTAFMRNIEANPLTCFAIDEGLYPYRKVIVSGAVEVVHEPGEDAAWHDLYRDIVGRYFDEQGTNFYLDSTKQLARYLISLSCRVGEPEVVTWRQPVGDEDPTGWWPSRYWEPTVPTGLT